MSKFIMERIELLARRFPWHIPFGLVCVGGRLVAFCFIARLPPLKKPAQPRLCRSNDYSNGKEFEGTEDQDLIVNINL